MLLEEKGQAGISAKNSIVDACEPLVIFTIDPSPLSLRRVCLGITHRHFIKSLQKEPDDFLIVVVGGHVKQCCVLIVDQFIDFGKEVLEKLLGFFMIKALDCFEELFLIDFSHL